MFAVVGPFECRLREAVISGPLQVPPPEVILRAANRRQILLPIHEISIKVFNETPQTGMEYTKLSRSSVIVVLTSKLRLTI